MARSRYRVIDEGAHFLTMTVVNWLPLLNAPWVVEHVLESLRFLQAQGRLVVYAYVIIENHLHLVASAEDLSKQMRTFKSYTARQIIDGFVERQAVEILPQLVWHRKGYKQDREHQFWQEGFRPKKILDIDMMKQKIEYIHHN